MIDPTFATPRSVYIHVPFCAHRCGYCDFTLITGREDLYDSYLRALELELSKSPPTDPFETIFIGGGTPTHFPPELLERLLKLLLLYLPIASGSEFSIEANPFGLSTEKLSILRDSGVNRISLGIQSFSQPILQTLERDHSPESALLALQECLERFQSVNCDLIFAVPGQSLEEWEESLEQVCALNVPHVSTYGLTFERGTSFFSRKMKGSIHPPSDVLEREMYERSITRLTDAGIAQYEISNFAQPGHECRHNRAYWSGHSHEGFGPGAVRYRMGIREQNHRSTTTWIRKVLSGESPIADSEQLSPEERARELLIVGLRMVEGILIEGFTSRTGFCPISLMSGALRRFNSEGWIEQTSTTIRLTPAGRVMADSIAVEIV